MATDNQNLAKLYQTQISLTEWLDGINHYEVDAFRLEDNTKRDRLNRLNQLIGLPYDKPTKFPASDIVASTPEFIRFLNKHGSELCAIRLIPSNNSLPKLRTRGLTIINAVEWMKQQQFNPEQYQVDFMPHDDQSTWATIFIINQQGIFGEITRGVHSELTQGNYRDHAPNTFYYDFKTWWLARPDDEALDHICNLTGMISISDPGVRQQLEQELNAQFSHNYLHGYFETTDSIEFGTWFKDYNRILARMYDKSSVRPHAPSSPTDTNTLLTGQTGSSGRVTGRVRLIDGPHTARLQPDEILVCRMTTPDYIPLMQQAAAIVTDLGGVLSHAAIVARELGKPCLAGTGNATKTLRDGQLIDVDATAGLVRST